MTRGAHSHPAKHHPNHPIRIQVMRPSYPDCLKEVQTTLINIDIWTDFTMYPNDQHRSPGYDVRVIDWSKASITRYHNSLSWPTSRHLQSQRTRWSDNKSLPTIISHDHLLRSLTAASPTAISDSRITYHDLCQPPVGWWWPCHHLVSSWQHKISPHH